jgi:hypothetical protein
MAFVQFTQPDDQPIVINTDRIVTATPLPDGQGTRITLNNGGYQDVKQLIADVLRQLNISAYRLDDPFRLSSEIVHFLECCPMSQMGQKRRSGSNSATSAPPLTADPQRLISAGEQATSGKLYVTILAALSRRFSLSKVSAVLVHWT